MRITEALLRQIIRHTLLEITRTGSLKSGSIDYDEFTRWQKEKADEIDPNTREAQGELEFQWADSGSGVRVILYRQGEPIGFVVLNRFRDGHSISTLGLTSAARGGGLASKLYDYIIGKTRLYSDVHQTPEARRLWLRLAERYPVRAIVGEEMFPVVPNAEGTELVAAGEDGHPVYSDDEGSEARLFIDTAAQSPAGRG